MNNDEIGRLIRVGGLLYLVVIICGIFAQTFTVSAVIVSNDTAATAKNILSNESLFRAGMIAHVFTLISAALLSGILFMIFRLTSELLAMLLVIFNVVSMSIEGVSILYQMETLSILKSKILVDVFSADQINSMAYLPLRMQSMTYDLALIFFGIVCCLIATLMLRSKLLSRWVAYLMFVAGVCYLVNSFLGIALPFVRNMLLPYILVPCFVAELSLSINMIIRRRSTLANDV